MKSWEEELDRHLLARINAILASGQFIEPLKEAAADEEILGEMSAVEKALHAAGRQIINEVQPVVDRIQQKKTDTKIGDMPPQITAKELAMYQIGYHHYSVLKKLLDELLYERLGLTREVKLGFRQGFKIVKSTVQKPQPKEKSHDAG